jgi:hypothetical protein
MALNRYQSLHPAPFVEVVEEIIEEEEEIFDPEGSKISDDPFHEDVGYEKEETKASSQNYEEMLVAELREILKVRGLSTKGRKAELISRLEESDVKATDEVAITEEQETPAEAAVSEMEVSKYGENETINGASSEEA